MKRLIFLYAMVILLVMTAWVPFVMANTVTAESAVGMVIAPNTAGVNLTGADIAPPLAGVQFANDSTIVKLDKFTSDVDGILKTPNSTSAISMVKQHIDNDVGQAFQQSLSGAVLIKNDKMVNDKGQSFIQQAVVASTPILNENMDITTAKQIKQVEVVKQMQNTSIQDGAVAKLSVIQAEVAAIESTKETMELLLSGVVGYIYSGNTSAVAVKSEALIVKAPMVVGSGFLA